MGTSPGAATFAQRLTSSLVNLLWLGMRRGGVIKIGAQQITSIKGIRRLEMLAFSSGAFALMSWRWLVKMIKKKRLTEAIAISGGAGILLSGLYALSLNVSDWAPCLAAPPKSLAGPVTVKHSPASSETAAPLAHQVPAEIMQLWQSPSPAYAAATGKIGLENRDFSINKLRGFFQNNPGNKTERLAASYALGRLLAHSQFGADQNEAMTLFAQSQSMPLLHIASLWHTAEILTVQGDEKKIREFVERILRDPAAKPDAQARALYELAQSFMREQDTIHAKELFLTLRQKHLGTEYATAANYYLGQMALTDAGAGADPKQAMTYFSDYLKDSVNGRFSAEVADKLLAFGSKGALLTAADLERIGLVYYRKGDYAKALDAFEKSGTTNNQFRKAQCQAKLHRKAESIAALLLAIKQSPESTYYDDFADVVTGPLSRAETAQVWKQILALKPVKLDHALWNIAVRSTDQEARPLFRRLVDQYPTSEHAPEAMWWMFWHNLKNIYPGGIAKNKAMAIELANSAENTAKVYHTHRSAARFLFWAGKIHEHLGDHARARGLYQQAFARYPANYYGHRAQARLAFLNAPADKRRDRGWSTTADRPNSTTNWNWPEPPALFDIEKIARFAGPEVALLAAARQMDECQQALNAAAGKEGASLHDDMAGFRSWLLLNQGLIMEGIRAAGKDLDGKPSRSPLWQIDYPWAYAARIKEQGQLRKVDPYLIHALIREESRYFPRALSRSQAMGLMQLLPATAIGVAKRISVPIVEKDDIFIPDNNIKLGTAYLEYTLKRFNGNAMLAVASYNGGPNAVKSWVDRFHAAGGSDWDYFVEEIPYRETRDYVRKVFGSYFVYENLY